MKRIFKYTTLIGILLMGYVATSCSDVDDLVTPEYARAFSPTELSAKISNKTNIIATWSYTKGAESFNLEVYQGTDESGTKVGTYNVSAEEVPYTVTGLEGETEYMIRVQTVGTRSDQENSKWTSISITTGTEQILYIIDPEDITPNSVTFRWPEGQTATKITMSPGNIEYILTDVDIAAGVATINGLVGETTYTAKLMNGTKTRGTMSFTTGVDVGGAIEVRPEDDFVSMLSNAQPGDAFALHPGTYGSNTKFVVKASVEIKAVRPNNKPILQGNISIENGASLLLKEIVLDGSTITTANQAIIFATAGTTYGALNVQGCEIKNHAKGLFYLNVASLIESITFNNCLIYNIVCDGGDFMDSRAGAYRTLTLSNSTVYNSCAARDLIRYDNVAAYAGTAPVINVTHCTLVGVAGGAANRIFYVRFVGNSINFNNNLVTNTLGLIANQAATAIPTFNNNNYFGAAALLTGSFGDASATQLDPKYKDAANGDFTVTNEAVQDKRVGDPRWLPAQ